MSGASSRAHTGHGDTHMAGDQRKVVEKRGPVDRLEFGLQLLDHEADRLLQVVQAQLQRLQQRIAHFLLALHAADAWTLPGSDETTPQSGQTSISN